MKYFFLAAILFTAFTSCQRTDKTKDHGSEESDVPLKIALNTDTGYKINSFTKKEIKPLLNGKGDTVITGVPRHIQGKQLLTDTLPAPVKLKVELQEIKVPFYQYAGKRFQLNTLSGQPDSVSEISFKVPVDSNYQVNDMGQKVVTGVPINIKHEVHPVGILKELKAGPFQSKEIARQNLRYVDVEQGLCSSNIFSMIMDKNHLLWMGTDGGGLSRFDGNDFLTINSENGLIDNRVFAICEDSKGRIWAGTTHGLSVFDGHVFTNYSSNDILSSVIRCIYEDNKGNVWIGSYGGLSKFDGKKFTHYTTKEGLPNNCVMTITEDKNGLLWFGTWGGGLCSFDGHVFRAHRNRSGGKQNVITSIFFDKENKLWAGTYGGGVSIFDGQMFSCITKTDGILSDIVMSVIEDNDGNIWFATPDGLNKLDHGRIRALTINDGLPINNCWKLLTDNTGQIYVGTLGGGLVRINEKSFVNYSTVDMSLGPVVYCVYEDRDENIWISTNKSGLAFGNSEVFKKVKFSFTSADFEIRRVIQDKEGDIWIGTYGGGLIKYDGKDFWLFTTRNGLSSNYINSLFVDSKGDVIISTDGGGGICKISKNLKNGKKELLFTHFTEQEGLSNNTVISSVEDSKGNLWIGTYGGGVCKLMDQQIVCYTEKEGLSNNFVYSIFEDTRGDIWLGTYGGGLNRFDGKNFWYYTRKQGITDNLVWTTREDDNGNIWVSTEKGLDRISSSLKREEGYLAPIIPFAKQDGLKSLEFQANSVLYDRSKRMWWGTGNGIVGLDLNEFSIGKNAPLVHLKSIAINGKTPSYRAITDTTEHTFTFDSISPFFNVPLGLKVPYDMNHFTFSYAATEWIAPHKLKYSFKIEELYENWSVPSSDLKAEYRNLSYGTYTFKLRAVGENGMWSAINSYTFTILPPWWHTWWARLLFLIGGVFIIVGIVKFRTRQLRQNQMKLEQQIMLATNEIRLQKEEIEEAHTNIKDSINYAKRIQTAILPPGRVIMEHLPESFVFYKPKDIVAGDFYWIESVNYTDLDLVLFAAADCTGHGVPGALVSVVCNSALNRSIREYGLTDPGKILDKTRELIIQEFEKSDEEVKDGMDISLCVFNSKEKSIKWAGANNPLWIIRNNSILEEIKPDKQPIGKYLEPRPFNTHVVNLEKGDKVYVFTDGFQDQFGGKEGKKYKTSRMKELLLTIHNENMDKQRALIEKAFEDWKGNLEQVDDVCIIGVKI